MGFLGKIAVPYNINRGINMTGSLVTSNSHITDSVTLFDFMPIGTAVGVDSATGKLYLLSQNWQASNFLPYGFASDGANFLIFHSSLIVDGGYFRLSFNGNEITAKAAGPTFYDTSGLIFLYPTVLTNPTSPYFMAHAYDETTRTWYFQIIRSSDRKIILDVEGIARSIPLWVGKAGGDYIGQGISSNSIAVECWGGYIDFCNLTKCIFVHPITGVTYNLPNGRLSVDREYHKACVGTSAIGVPLEYTAMELRTPGPEEIDFLFIRAANPLPSNLYTQYPDLFVDLEQTGRINFVTRGRSYQVDKYIYSDNGWDTTVQPFRPPTEYYIDAVFSNGEIHMIATPLVYSPDSYWGWDTIEGTKTWWDLDCYFSWGRTFVKWNGTITLDGVTKNITNELGIGEFSRYSSKDTLPSSSSSYYGLILGTGLLLGAGALVYFSSKSKK